MSESASGTLEGSHAARGRGDPRDAAVEAVTAEDLGLPPHARVPLRFRPAHSWSPVIVSFPHIGLGWPHDLRPKPQADFARNADYEVQTIYPDLAALGIATVEAIYSRLVVDLNRAADDVSVQLVPDHPAPRPRSKPGAPASGAPSGWDRPGRGVVWASAVAAGAGASVRILQPPLPYAAFAQRITRYHAPYYRALELLLARRREQFGYAVLLDAHSMPGSVGVDLVLGTLDGASCHESISAAAYASLQGDGSDRRALLSVRRNSPYRGGEVVRHFGRPREGIHALQLEVNRRLYMDEQTYAVRPHPTGDDVSATHTPARRGPPVPQDAASRTSRPWPHSNQPSATAHGAAELAELLRRVRSLVCCLSTLQTSGGDAFAANAVFARGSAEPAPS